MKIEKQKTESGAAGKPGESTAAKTEVNLTASGMADLLKSEFAADTTPETSPAQEIPAADATPGAENETKVETASAEETPAEGETASAEENPGEGEQETPGEETPPEETPLPEDAQAALAAWEETGGPLPKPLQALVDKRIGKLTASARTEKERADKAESQLQTLTAEIEALRNDPNRPAYQTPHAVAPEQQLIKLTETAKKFAAEVENYLDETATDEERTRVERYMESERLDAKGLKRRLRETQEYLAQDLPEQRKQLATFRAQEAQVAPVAKAYFPFLADKASPDYAEAQQVLSLMPELTVRTPAHSVAVGTYVLGNRIIQHLQAAGVKENLVPTVLNALKKAFPVTGKPAPVIPKSPPPKSPANNGSAPTKVKINPLDVASQKFNQNPNRQSAEAMAKAALLAG